jgi:hypothetical protein
MFGKVKLMVLMAFLFGGYAGVQTLFNDTKEKAIAVYETGKSVKGFVDENPEVVELAKKAANSALK